MLQNTLVAISKSLGQVNARDNPPWTTDEIPGRDGRSDSIFANVFTLPRHKQLP